MSFEKYFLSDNNNDQLASVERKQSDYDNMLRIKCEK